MNISRTLRYLIIKWLRFWNALKSEIRFILEPIDKLPKYESENSNSNTESTPKSLSVPAAAEDRPENKKNPKETWKDLTKWERFERVFKVLEGIGVVAGFLVLIFLFCQLKTMQAQTAAMTNQTTLMKRQFDEMKRQTDDSEAQQRAILKFDNFSFNLEDFYTNYNIKGLPKNWTIVHFTLKYFYTFKNVGDTPAVDLSSYGESFPESGFINKYFGTNTLLKRWDHFNIPPPSPNNSKLGTALIMPQETLTNGTQTISEEYVLPENYYVECWLSYRDIFNHSWIIGEGGDFVFSNRTFVPEFIYSGKYRDTNN
jgi:hypothetical protein